MDDRAKIEITSTLPLPATETKHTLVESTRNMLETVVGFKELIMMYSCAMKEVRTRFEILDTEFNTRYQRNPICYISTRLKTTSSILEKLLRNDIPVELASIEENICDIAGVRVICSYLDDVYTLADAFSRQENITVLKRKDYIKSPKPNGYRSLHLIVETPVHFSEQKKQMKVEVQIRTTTMDCWASLEHQMKYKQEIPNQDYFVAELKACAETLADTDQRMLALRMEIDSNSESPTEDEILFGKLLKLNAPLS